MHMSIGTQVVVKAGPLVMAITGASAGALSASALIVATGGAVALIAIGVGLGRYYSRRHRARGLVPMRRGRVE
jgi:hypothetical protein